uniref:Reverse transcriptase domain-containing protein n=1 Tax=Trichuris muris TaxID=70415 RepID=A0A5S6QRD6_TRIMR
MMQMGIVQPSKSNWASPLHLVPKKQADRYPVPHIHDVTAKLADKRIFSKVDLVRAYQQIPVDAADVPKTAIITPFGLYEYLRMPFGLRNAAQTFQRFMDEVARGLDFCYVYLDDILVASRSEQEHETHLKQLFQRLSEYGVKLNPEKCLSILRYRQFRQRAAVLLAPLERLLASKHTDGPLELPPDAITAFEKPKQALAEAVCLSHPKQNAPLSLVVDVSNDGAGAVLQQKLNGSWAPLSFFSRRFQPREYIGSKAATSLFSLMTNRLCKPFNEQA